MRTRTLVSHCRTVVVLALALPGLRKLRNQAVDCLLERFLVCLVTWIAQDKMLRCGALSREP